MPSGIDGTAVIKQMRTRYGITIAGGQDHLKGKIVRIAHIGYISEFDIITAISGLEMTLSDLGLRHPAGRGGRGGAGDVRRDPARLTTSQHNIPSNRSRRAMADPIRVLIADDMSKKAVEILSATRDSPSTSRPA